MDRPIFRYFAGGLALAAVVLGVLVGASDVFSPRAIRLIALALSVATALQAALPRVFAAAGAPLAESAVEAARKVGPALLLGALLGAGCSVGEVDDLALVLVGGVLSVAALGIGIYLILGWLMRWTDGWR